MQKSLFVLNLLIVVLISAGCRDSLRSAEMQKLQGRWDLVKEVHSGKEEPVDAEKKPQLIFDAEGNWRVEYGGEAVGGGTIKLDPESRPKSIDYAITQGKDTGKVFRAIYEQQGDTFRHCGVLDGERPTEFAAPEGSENYLVTFRRGK